MSNCNFCGDAIETGTGKMYVKRDGTVLHFCRAKCQRNQIGLGRINRHVQWTAAAHAAKANTKAGHKAAPAAVKPAKPKAEKATAKAEVAAKPAK